MKQFFQKHFEWLALTAGLLLIAAMNPYVDNGTSWCLLELAQFPYCPGEGLGHSIAFTVRGDLANAISANFMGPPAILIIAARIGYLLKTISKSTHKENLYYHG